MVASLRTTSPKWLLLAVLFGIGGGAVAPIAATSLTFQFYLACSVLTALVLAALWAEHRRSGDALNVLSLIGLFFLLGFVAGSIWLWIQFNTGFPRVRAYHLTQRGIVRAEWLAVIGWIGFVAGYRMGFFSLLRIPRLSLTAPSQRAADRAMAFLYVLGSVGRILAIHRGLYFHNISVIGTSGTVAVSSSSNQAISILSNLPLISVAYLGFRSQGRRPLRLVYYAGIVIEFGLALASGTRGNVIGVLLLLLGAAYYARGKFPVRATVIAILVAVFFVFPLLVIYRDASKATGRYQVSNLSSGFSTYSSGGIGGAIQGGIDQTLRRFEDSVGPAAMEDYGRHVFPMGFAGSLRVDFLNVLPHAIDPGKPVIDNWGNQLVYAYRLSFLKQSYIALSMLGEMYLDFGTIGTLFGMAVLGAVYRELNEILGARRAGNRIVGALFLAIMWPLISSQEAFIGDQLLFLVRSLIIDAILIKVALYAFSGRREAAYDRAFGRARPLAS